MSPEFIEKNNLKPGYQVAIVQGANFDLKMIGIVNFIPKLLDFTVYFFRKSNNLKSQFNKF